MLYYVVLNIPGVFNSDDSRPNDPCKNHTNPQCSVEYFYYFTTYFYLHFVINYLTVYINFIMKYHIVLA